MIYYGTLLRSFTALSSIAGYSYSQAIQQSDLSGKWVNKNKINWEWEFKDGTLIERDNDQLRFEAKYTLTKDGDNHTIVIDHKSNLIKIPISKVNGDKIRIKDGKKWVELVKQKEQ